MSKKGDKHYTKEEEQFIRDNYGKLSYSEMLLHFPTKSYSSLQSKCRRLLHLEPRSKKGSLNGNWRGGVSHLKSGYVRNNVEGKNVHTIVMENILGRPLESGEMIHHIDGNKSNNSPDNLLLCKNASDHRLIHASLEKVAFSLIQKGLIQFDFESRSYVESEDG